MDRQEFLDHLRRSRLLSSDQVDALATRYAAESPQNLATALIEEGVLTRYQAKRIWAGKSRAAWCWASTASSTSWARAASARSSRRCTR